MKNEKNYDKYTKEALDALSDVICGAEDLKLIISAAKEILSVTAKNLKKDEVSAPTVIIKGDVSD